VPIFEVLRKHLVQNFANWRNVAISPSVKSLFFRSLPLEPGLPCNGMRLISREGRCERTTGKLTVHRGIADRDKSGEPDRWSVSGD
jgi:hypothetical protein